MSWVPPHQDLPNTTHATPAARHRAAVPLPTVSQIPTLPHMLHYTTAVCTVAHAFWTYSTRNPLYVPRTVSRSCWAPSWPWTGCRACRASAPPPAHQGTCRWVLHRLSGRPCPSPWGRLREEQPANGTQDVPLQSRLNKPYKTSMRPCGAMGCGQEQEGMSHELMSSWLAGAVAVQYDVLSRGVDHMACKRAWLGVDQGCTKPQPVLAPRVLCTASWRRAAHSPRGDGTGWGSSVHSPCQYVHHVQLMCQQATRTVSHHAPPWTMKPCSTSAAQCSNTMISTTIRDVDMHNRWHYLAANTESCEACRHQAC